MDNLLCLMQLCEFVNGTLYGTENNAAQSKSLFPKPDKSTFGVNWVFNIIVQNYIRASNRVKFRSR